MVLPIAAAPASKSIMKKLFFHLPSIPPPRILPRRFSVYSITKASSNGNKLGDKRRSVKDKQQQQKTDSLVKRRTRSDRELDEEGFAMQFGNGGSAHVPVMLGEVLDVFASVPLKSFVDCTLGAGGHSAAIIQAHPEMEFYVGLDVDPVAHQIAQAQIDSVLHKASGCRAVDLQVHTLLKNFGSIKVVLRDTGVQHAASGVDGILMDLGISSMQVNNAERGFSVLNNGPLDMRMNPQASLKAEDILNSWSASEVGRILRDYGEESNWYSLQNKIVKARMAGGLHSTGELVNLIRGSTSPIRGGRQGWIKTATRVFQALRIAVNDELNTLKESIHSSFSSLSCGGRLAVISFHSLEDRIVKQAFLDIVSSRDDAMSEDRRQLTDLPKLDSYKEKEAWIKQIINGSDGTILTKRPITPSEAEERLNPRSRSAKLRVIEKIRS